MAGSLISEGPKRTVGKQATFPNPQKVKSDPAFPLVGERLSSVTPQLHLCFESVSVLGGHQKKEAADFSARAAPFSAAPPLRQDVLHAPELPTFEEGSSVDLGHRCFVQDAFAFFSRPQGACVSFASS